LSKRKARRRLRHGLLDRVGRRVPRRIGLPLLAGLFATVGLYGSVLGGQYEDFVAFEGEPHHVLARALGFGIDTVTITGIDELNEVEVLQAAGIDSRTSLAFLDAAAVRDRLMSLPLVKEAAVRKLYPSSLSITLTEGEPFALWQNQGEVFVVSKTGTIIEPLSDPRFNALPLVVGEGAAARAAGFLALLDAHPEVKAHVRAAILTGARRWNLKLDNGLDVKLPEAALPASLERLSGLITEQRLLDKDILALDMRQPDRLVLRLTEEAAAARQEALKAKLKARGGAT
jgi:cell division protein FtsQ